MQGQTTKLTDLNTTVSGQTEKIKKIDELKTKVEGQDTKSDLLKEDTKLQISKLDYIITAINNGMEAAEQKTNNALEAIDEEQKKQDTAIEEHNKHLGQIDIKITGIKSEQEGQAKEIKDNKETAATETAKLGEVVKDNKETADANTAQQAKHNRR
ncbi:hypothetical protein CWO85_03160 [Candidatus Phytoplasma ziziphi]|uniref:Uncharacterized protein n=1 Tax=Ziziphus jujuba witches'-broom phytoplasma TaxID=135727 RepID=A0A660HNV6_ZIZJU|nr:hypothetical protein [Candidatus Phytoplasma ziziphi]AYJ01476.1 hypothetical protein CWO85_03160 [Candidatus Phytoplasma ziziphi]